MRKCLDWLLCRKQPIDESEDRQEPTSNPGPLTSFASEAEEDDARRLRQERSAQEMIKRTLAQHLLLMNLDVPEDRSPQFQKSLIISDPISALKNIIGQRNKELYKVEEDRIFYHPTDLSKASEPHQLASALLGQLRKRNLTQFQSCRTEADGTFAQQEFRFSMEVPYQDSPSAESEIKKFIFIIGADIKGKIIGYGLRFADKTITERPNFQTVVAGYSEFFAKNERGLMIRGEEMIVAPPAQASAPEDSASGVFAHSFGRDSNKAERTLENPTAASTAGGDEAKPSSVFGPREIASVLDRKASKSVEIPN